MKLSTLAVTSLAALAAAALITSGASAAPEPNIGKSTDYKLDPDNPDAEKQCIEKGASVKDGMCVMASWADTPQPAATTTIDTSRSGTSNTSAPGTTKEKRICIVYKPGHEGDDRYCSQSVPAPK